jgi:hypothetical protein
VHSWRVASSRTVYHTYSIIHAKLITYVKEAGNRVWDTVVQEDEFNYVLLLLNIMLAHGEPSRHQRYSCWVDIKIFQKTYNIDLGELVGCIESTPIQFLNYHAESVYQYCKKNNVNLEFGRLFGLPGNYPGVGFIGFPFTISATVQEKHAFRMLVAENPPLQRYLVDSCFF